MRDIEMGRWSVSEGMPEGALPGAPGTPGGKGGRGGREEAARGKSGVRRLRSKWQVRVASRRKVQWSSWELGPTS